MQPSRTRIAFYYSLLWLVALLFFLPVFWILMASFKTPDDILAVPPQFLFQPTLDNIVSMLTRPNFLMFLILSTRMVPAAAFVVPIFQMYNAFQWRNQFGVLMLYTMFSIPFSLWILKGFIDGVSPRYDETGFVNGASRLHVMFRVVLPQVRPGLIAAFIFNLIFVWNEFLLNFILGGPGTQMIPYALAVGLTDSGGNVDWAFVASLSTGYVLLPTLMIFFFQKYLLVGMTFGTVRGEV